MRMRAVFGALVLVACGALSAQAQQPGKQPVTGTIVDAATGRPVFAARVSIQDSRKSTYSDTAGHFVLYRVPAGPAVVEVEQLGYNDFQSTIEVQPGSAPLAIALEPNPVMLKSITVLTDRFKQRRNATVMSVRAFDRQALLLSGAYNMRQFLETRSGAMPVNCTANAYYYGLGFGGHGAFDAGGPFGSGDAGLGCVYVRGQVVRPAVYIDDRPAFSDELMMYHPQDFFLIEVYGRGTVVRGYTTWWIQSMAGQRLGPLPYF